MTTNAERDLKRITSEIEKLSQKIAELNAKIGSGDVVYSALKAELASYQAQLKLATEEQKKLNAEIAKTGKSSGVQQPRPSIQPAQKVPQQKQGTQPGVVPSSDISDYERKINATISRLQKAQERLSQSYKLDPKTQGAIFPPGTEERIEKISARIQALSRTLSELRSKSSSGGIREEGEALILEGGHPDSVGKPLPPESTADAVTEILRNSEEAAKSSKNIRQYLKKLENALSKGSTTFEKELGKTSNVLGTSSDKSYYLGRLKKAAEAGPEEFRKEVDKVKKEVSYQNELRKVEEEGAKLSAKLKKEQLAAEKIAAEKAMKAAEAKQKAADNELRKIDQAGGQLSARLRLRQLKADERAAKAAEEEARMRELRAKVASDPRYAQALEQAAKLGLGISDLKEVLDKGGGVQRLSFERMSESGVKNKGQFFVDRYGKSTPGLSSQFRTFGSDILRDIGQFTKWSIAVAAVYTPIQKLGELLTNMVDIQSRLADATIATNTEFEKSGEIFDTAYEAAKRAGEGVLGVVDAYTAAYRAAGRLTDPVERQQAAVDLLNSSLILSKLSTLDQATAIDTLSAALLQSEKGLDQGEELLNKWVRVSQVANVTIDTLATGVAVLGDAAEAAGLDIDKLNGLIAVLSEQSISGSKEAANTAKALIGAYQSDTAEATLSKFGFALRRANGEVREFLDVYQELAKAREQGILSEADISEIATALGGGGSRRAKDVAALINSQDRLNQIARESAEIAGDSTLAQDALEKKMMTVETATTRLNNAFQSLAQTLGNDGGLLDAFTLFINLTTKLVEALDSLFTLVGKSGPSLAVITTAALAMSRISGSRIDTLLTVLGTAKGGKAYTDSYMEGRLAMATGLGGPPSPEPAFTSAYGSGIGRGILADILMAGGGYKNAGAYRGGAILGALGVGASAASNIASGEGDRAAANVIGGLIGGAIGSTFGPMGIAIGANIGSAIGESFVKNVIDFAPEWQKLFLPDVSVSPREDTEVSERQKLLNQLKEESGNFDILMTQLITGVIRNTPEFAYRGLFSILEKTPLGVKNEEEFLKQRKGMYAETILLQWASPELRKRIEELEARRKIREGEVDISTGKEYDAEREKLQSMVVEERQKLLGQLSRGEISSSEFGRMVQQMSGFPSLSIRGIRAFGEELDKVSGNINSVDDAYRAFLYLVENGTKEQTDQLSKYITDIEYLERVLSTFSKEDIGTQLELSFGNIKISSREQLEQLLKGIKTEAGVFTDTAITQAQLQKTNLPSIIGSPTEPTKETDASLIEEEARKMQRKFYKEMGLSDEQIKMVEEKLEEFAVLVGDAAENHYKTITGIDQRFWEAAKKTLEELNKISSEKKLGFQEYDVDRATLERLAQQSLAIGQAWADRFNYDFRPEDQIAISQEGIVKPLHADFRILALLLEKIVDQNQKQLDGQYNIPEGATFWVPITAAYYRNKGGGSGLDMNGLVERSFQMEGSVLREPAQKLIEAANTLLAAGTALGSMSSKLNPFVGTQVGIALGAKPPVIEEVQKSNLKNTGLSTGWVNNGIYSFRGQEGNLLGGRIEREKSVLERLFGHYRDLYSREQSVGARVGGFEKSGVIGGSKESMDFISMLKQNFLGMLDIFAPNRSVLGGQSGIGTGLGKDIGKSFTGQLSQQNAPVQQAKLDIKLESTTNLVVDGRVLASIIKPFIAADLLRTEATQGTITKKYII